MSQLSQTSFVEWGLVFAFHVIWLGVVWFHQQTSPKSSLKQVDPEVIFSRLTQY